MPCEKVQLAAFGVVEFVNSLRAMVCRPWRGSDDPDGTFSSGLRHWLLPSAAPRLRSAPRPRGVVAVRWSVRTRPNGLGLIGWRKLGGASRSRVAASGG